MVRFFLGLSLLHALSVHVPSALAACGDDASGDAKAVERVNRRYDDFFRFQAHEDEREAVRNRGRHDLHGTERAHQAELEKARLAFIKTRRRPVDHDADMEREMAQLQARRDHASNQSRECYVRQQDRVDALRRRGRAIPENREYDLDGLN